MKKIVLTLCVSLFLASAVVHADPTSSIPNLTDIPLDGNGNGITMGKIEATQYCQNLGDRLPTARELALWATQYGAKVSNTPQNGFEEIQATDAAGNSDTFYYQRSGYQNSSDERLYWYWSSSILPGESSLEYILDGYCGVFAFNDHHDTACSDGDYYTTVRCVQSR
jgi:hypothetical protein